jgi:2-polyprenyl-3-methyl-5-hydroxy-6-metoxy-1,4-benzoquinol methylase
MTRSFPEQDGPLARCRICRGDLELARTGTAGPHHGAAFAPSCHTPGAHGDLFRCRECGTVQQPSLPRGAALHELYRDMRDDDYLAEEEGRRETARRLLDLLGGQVAAGRLLDVGCGHGLLLDEARKRGYDVEGLELSRDAARHARERLELTVREQPLEDAALDDERYDAIVLTDVLEHLEDPVGALARCTRLLAPGGALLVVTPDPASRTARLAGRRWWGYLPAHLCLVPRATLRELMTAGGLVLAHDVPFVRSFSAGYWLRGLGERGGALGRALDAVSRRLPPTATLSLSLGDERVVVATKALISRPERPVATDRGAPAAVHAVLPAYKAERTVARVAEALPTGALDRALLVDDASPDGTRAAALAAGLEVLVHPVNRGYGANQKTCYVRAALDGADVVVMVHGDNQYDPSLVAEMVKPIEDGRADVVIGSRLLQDETIAGGMPRWKWVGNRGLTWVENRAFRRSFSEYHTGYRAFSVDFLRTIAFLRNDDGFVFDQEIFAQIVAADARVVELAIPTRYFLEASSVSFSRSVEYGLRTLAVLARFRLDERRGRWLLLRRPATDLRGLADEAEPAATSPW